MMYDHQTARALYKKLLGLYPRAFREQLGESMEQTFNDLCNERKQQAQGGLFGFVLWMFVETAIGIVDVLGSLIVFGAFSLSVLACIIVRAPIVRTLQAGGSLFAHPINLVLTVAILILVTMVVGGIIIDQYPCWIGVPNCD
jgi:hypothetical protein